MRHFIAFIIAAALAGCGGGETAKEDADKQEFLALVKKNAQDPASLEIVTWGKMDGDSRRVRFRCRLVGSTPRGAPIMTEDADVAYKDGKIVRISTGHTIKTWLP